MESNEAKPKATSQRQKLQRVLARTKFQMLSMKGNLSVLSGQVAEYNNSVPQGEMLGHLQRDLRLLQNHLNDVLLDVNYKFAQMKLETLEKQNKSK